jgi:hypothetical protein
MHPSDQVVSPVAIVQTKRGLESNRAKRNEVDANPGRHLHVVEMGVNRVDLCVWGAPAEARRRCLSFLADTPA